jgi:hypothetical protein
MVPRCVREIGNQLTNLSCHEYGWRGSKQVLCPMINGVQALHIYDVCLAYSFVHPLSLMLMNACFILGAGL